MWIVGLKGLMLNFYSGCYEVNNVEDPKNAVLHSVQYIIPPCAIMLE